MAYPGMSWCRRQGHAHRICDPVGALPSLSQDKAAAPVSCGLSGYRLSHCERRPLSDRCNAFPMPPSVALDARDLVNVNIRKRIESVSSTPSFNVHCCRPAITQRLKCKVSSTLGPHPSKIDFRDAPAPSRRSSCQTHLRHIRDRSQATADPEDIARCGHCEHAQLLAEVPPKLPVLHLRVPTT